MSLQLFDPPSDSLGGFASEASTTPPPESEPAFLRTPTLDDAQPSIATLYQESRSQRGRIWLVATVSVAVGVLAGFAAGYAIAYRVTVPAASATPLPVQPRTSQPARTERATQAASAATVPAPALPAGASTVPVPSTRSSTTAEPRVTNVESRTPNREPRTASRVPRTPNPEPRSSTTERLQPAVVPTAGHGGTIEIQSHPQGAQVILDGSVIGQAPLSIADVAEGTHEVRLELAGFNPWVASVRVTGGNRARIGASLEK